MLSNEIVFEVTEDPVDGGFVASALGVGINTEADTLEELRTMVKDAVQCHFDKRETEERPSLIRLHFVRDEVFSA
jgi:predicted RNase H-like HicB family nuclease